MEPLSLNKQCAERKVSLLCLLSIQPHPSLLSSPLFLPPPHPCPAFLSFFQPLPFHFSLPVPQAMPGDIKQTQSV